jgi:hypothetical protein
VLATYVRDTSPAVYSISTGVIRKQTFREFITVDGTGANSVWAMSGVDVTNLEGGIRPASNRVNAAIYWTEFCTGFDIRGTSSPSESNSVLVTINGLTANTTNFPSATFQVAGNWSFNSATGVLNMNNASTTKSSLSINSLTLGVQNIRMLNQQDGGNLQLHSLDVVTPIYSTRSNLYADIQNTLPVGSNGISDNRKITAVKDFLPVTKAWAQAVGVNSSPSTTSTTFIPVPDLSVTIKTGNSFLKISYTICNSNNGANQYNAFQINVDGIPVSTLRYETASATGQDHNTSDNVIIPVSAGTHKVDVFWRVGSGTGTLESQSRTLTVEEK